MPPQAIFASGGLFMPIEICVKIDYTLSKENFLLCRVYNPNIILTVFWNRNICE